jgi:putative ABC transport system permease protein
MLKSYFLVAWRSIKRNRLHTTINIVGLAVGMAVCILITLYVQFELTYDRQNKRAERLYRMAIDLEANNWAISAFPIGQLLKDNFAEVETFTRIRPTEIFVHNEDADIKLKERVFFADSSVFDVLDINLLQGNPTKALAEVNSLVLTPQKAKTYFGNADPIGKTLKLLNDNTVYTITGVFEPLPSNSHVHMDIMVSSDNFGPMKPGSPQGWQYLTNHYTYLVLPANFDYQKFEVTISEFMDKYQELTPDQPRNRIKLQPLTEIHLYSNRGLEVEANGNINTVYTMAAVAFFILIIACINFMNLTTAQSLKRAREVGIRKVVGSRKEQLVMQFLSESVLISLFALVLAALFLLLSLPYFNEFTGKHISLNPIENPWVAISFVSVTLIVGLLAGTYPAFVLSDFNPNVVLKGAFVTNSKGQRLRRALVVFQFAIAFIIMAGAYTIYLQLEFMLNKNMGFDREQVLVLDLPNDSIGEASIKDEMLRLSGVEAVTRMGEIPGNMVRTTTIWFEGAPNNQPQNMYHFSADADALQALGMKMKFGEYFHPDTKRHFKEFVINETALKLFGWKKEEAIGKEINFGERGEDPGKVIGVMEDFHFKHLHDKIDPLVMYLQPIYEGEFMAIKVKTSEMQQMVTTIGNRWKELVPNYEFEYRFLDESFDKLFDQEKKLGQLFTVFSSLAVFVSCLGLFGLASFTLEQTRKATAVRKVLGASVMGLVMSMSKEFLMLVFIGLVVAIPITYYALSHWLNSFAYHIPFNWVVFIVVGVLGALVALATVCYHSLVAAMANPVKALKEQ